MKKKYHQLVVCWINQESGKLGCFSAMFYKRDTYCVFLFAFLHSKSSIFITKTRLFKYIENFTSKNWKFSDKNSDIFYTSAQNIDCGYSLEPPRQGGSNEYPQSMFWSRKKKNNVYPCKLQFYYIKAGFKGVKYRHVFVMWLICVTCSCTHYP